MWSAARNTVWEPQPIRQQHEGYVSNERIRGMASRLCSSHCMGWSVTMLTKQDRTGTVNCSPRSESRLTQKRERERERDHTSWERDIGKRIVRERQHHRERRKLS